ncbi:MAG TPA: MFS transporter, partial [bacterium]|nr:MFS transporter [bacterium]
LSPDTFYLFLLSRTGGHYIMSAYGWNNVQVMWIFSIAICFLGIGATIGGMNLAKFGPRKLATAGAVMWGVGWIVGAIAMSMKSLPLFYIGYGVIGGLGLGLGYVTPVATAAKWFPDKKGFITGMVVMGFGLGALLMSKILAPIIMDVTQNDLVTAFMYIGVALLVLGIPAGLIMKNPRRVLFLKVIHLLFRVLQTRQAKTNFAQRTVLNQANS